MAATLRPLLFSKDCRVNPCGVHAHSLRSFQGSKHALVLNNSSQCVLNQARLSLSSDASCATSTSSSESLDGIQMRSEKLVLHRRAECLLGLGAVVGTMLSFPENAHAVETALNSDVWSSILASEPKNALSLPTWVIHVASVAEWITAMTLVWRYGDTPGNSTWKGLSWGMIPLLGGAMCACTWHFFYNAQSLEILVVLQAALTALGNFTMWGAAYRIYRSSKEQSKAP